MYEVSGVSPAAGSEGVVDGESGELTKGEDVVEAGKGKSQIERLQG